ncbi:thiamine biosynthesis protein ThiS [Flexistipes sinusarabici DSM 4947]|uniref:Thiamine biosynthesis protein ThiS n=1 Tax=Flexistipes sinusarabici (strain ATCC 49648 / DSM 4947 / MAS 10) TaxID=717231 RepID=F8E5V1_FLESM|nr:sulfur carrier protein ThiS [Flexistipes sinusarabici]AEI15792.1 thiamine biosynthesis protein ThiS [Flexistipes sinusarabici DSM 4947]
MNIIVNGKKREIAESLTVKELLKQFDIKPDSVVVELNRDIIGQEQFGITKVKENDQLEIVHFVGGG